MSFVVYMLTNGYIDNRCRFRQAPFAFVYHKPAFVTVVNSVSSLPGTVKVVTFCEGYLLPILSHELTYF